MVTKEQLIKDIKEKLNEANFKSGVSGTSLAKLPAKIKKILIDDLRISTYHLNQIYFDKHLKQLMIITNQIALDRPALEKLLLAPEFLGIQFMNDPNHTIGLAISFRYNGGVGKKKPSKKDDPELDLTWDDESFELENN
jgi:polyphosphate kinase